MTFHSAENLYHISFSMYFLNCHKPHPFFIQKESYTLERILSSFKNLRMHQPRDAPLGFSGATINKKKQWANIFRLRRLARRCVIGLALGFFLFCFFFFSTRHFWHFYSHPFLYFFLLMFLFSISTMFFVFHSCVRYY